MNIQVKYLRKDYSVSLRYSSEKVAYSRNLDAERVVDYAGDGEIRGIHFLGVRYGINTDGLPHRSAIERALQENGFAGLVLKPGFIKPNRQNPPSNESNAPSFKARISMWGRVSLAVLIFIGSAFASVILARNLFVTNSLEGLVASVTGLVATLAPFVIGCFILIAWVVYSINPPRRL